MKVALVLSFLVLLTACDESKGPELSQNNNKTLIEKSKKPELLEAASSSDPKYTAELVPEKMTVQKKKERFKYLLVPAVKRVYLDLDQQFKEIKIAIEAGSESERISLLKKEYKADSDSDLLARLKPHPVSIVLAQAAMESAWATSRFFVQAKNIFGVWSFNKNEPRIAAGEKRGNKTIWLKKYKSIEEAVRDNYRVLARGAAFKKFRTLRTESNDPFKLVKGLDKYSELGSKYGKELASVIRYNKFNQFDF